MKGWKVKGAAVLLGGAAFCTSLSVSAAAFDLAGKKQITLRTREGASIPIGSVTFDRAGADGKVVYRLDLDMERFKTFFLSMRDFKCLEGPELQCYVPYPYANPHTVAANDFRWLEHDLLFFFKDPNAYGAKLGNGLYYALAPQSDSLVGRPQEVDLDKIAAPPDNLRVPPFTPEDRDDLDGGSRWIAQLTIR